MVWYAGWGKNGLNATCTLFLYHHQASSTIERYQLDSPWQGSLLEVDPWSWLGSPLLLASIEAWVGLSCEGFNSIP